MFCSSSVVLFQVCAFQRIGTDNITRNTVRWTREILYLNLNLYCELVGDNCSGLNKRQSFWNKYLIFKFSFFTMGKIKLQYYFLAAGIGFLSSFVALVYRFATQEPDENHDCHEFKVYLRRIVRFVISGEFFFSVHPALLRTPFLASPSPKDPIQCVYFKKQLNVW